MNFILPENINYQCIQCGLCCQKNWIIGIDDTSYTRLLELDWKNARPDLASRQLFITFLKPPSTGEQYTFSRTENGACIFLTKDNRCQIHASFDYETKAQVCKEFPYHFVETPDGVVVGLSFACTAVRESTGPSVVKNLEEIQQIYQNHYRKETIQEPIVLVSSMTLTWQEYIVIEQALLQILTDSAYSFETALIAGSILINVAVGLKQVELQAQAAQKTSQETLQGGLIKLQLEKYRHIFEIALKAKKVSIKSGSTSALTPFITWMQFVERKQSRIGLVFNLYKNYLKLRTGRGVVPSIFTQGKKIQITELAQVEFNTNRPELNDYFRCYFTHVIFRNNLIPARGVFRGYYTLLAFYALGKWIAKANAAAEKRNKVELRDVQTAAGILDSQIVLHAQFGKIFSLSSYLTLLIDRLYLNPHYPARTIL